MKYIYVLFIAILFTVSCKTAAKPESADANPNAKRYKLKGEVVSIDKTAKTALIKHEAITGFMEAETMEFPIREDWVWNELAPGAAVQADLVVDNTATPSFWLEKIGIVALPNPNQPPPPTPIRPQVGKSVPAIKLTDQSGKRFSLTDYRGKTLAVTFIYSECPLPNYCIKMSQNFSDAAAQIAADPAAKDKLKLVSISFDPARDTPAKLTQYGLGYMGNPAKPDFSTWRLAVGSTKEIRSVADFFGLKYETDTEDKTKINHSLVTAIIGPDGVVRKFLDGNRWKPEDLIREMSAVATAAG